VLYGDVNITAEREPCPTAERMAVHGGNDWQRYFLDIE
jgi:hypothetical protein